MKDKIQSIFGVDQNFLLEVLINNNSAMGYLHGALSEELIKEELEDLDFEVFRIKEKPAGGFDSKVDNYKGDFLVKKPTDNLWLVIECKGLKTNSEFRGKNKIGENNRKSIINKINSVIKADKNKIYEKGYNKYKTAKEEWETKNPGKKFPDFEWNKDYPGPDSVNLKKYFSSKKDIENYFNKIAASKFDEQAFRNKEAAYLNCTPKLGQ